MRKVMLLAAMLAMVLAAAAPVFAQDTNINVGDNVEYNAVCQNIAGEINTLAAQGGGATADADAGDDAAAIAEVAQEQNVSVAQVNECLNNFETATATATTTATPTATVKAKKWVWVHGKKAKVVWIKGKKFVVVHGKTVTATATATSSATSSATATASATSSATAKTATLPETGGASLFALGAGALLVGGGLLARRIVR